jgi:hypothetical protein
MKPKVADEGADEVATGDWDVSTDLNEGLEGSEGWDDEVTTPTGHLANAV